MEIAGGADVEGECSLADDDGLAASNGIAQLARIAEQDVQVQDTVGRRELPRLRHSGLLVGQHIMAMGGGIRQSAGGELGGRGLSCRGWRGRLAFPPVSQSTAELPVKTERVRTIERGLNVLAILIGLGLVVRLFMLIDRMAVDMLFWDQFAYYTGIWNGDSLWRLFRWQHGPHRMGLGFPIMAWIDSLTGWNQRVQAFVVGVDHVPGGRRSAVAQAAVGRLAELV